MKIVEISKIIIDVVPKWDYFKWFSYLLLSGILIGAGVMLLILT